MTEADSSSYVAANGVDHWFEIWGKGEPLLLLHGGLMSTAMFGPVRRRTAPEMSANDVDPVSSIAGVSIRHVHDQHHSRG